MFKFMSNRQYDAIAEIVDNQEKIIKQKEEEIIFLREQVKLLRNILQGTSTGGYDDLDFPNSSVSSTSTSSDNIFY